MSMEFVRVSSCRNEAKNDIHMYGAGLHTIYMTRTTQSELTDYGDLANICSMERDGNDSIYSFWTQNSAIK